MDLFQKPERKEIALAAFAGVLALSCYAYKWNPGRETAPDVAELPELVTNEHGAIATYIDTDHRGHRYQTWEFKLMDNGSVMFYNFNTANLSALSPPFTIEQQWAGVGQTPRLRPPLPR